MASSFGGRPGAGLGRDVGVARCPHEAGVLRLSFEPLARVAPAASATTFSYRSLRELLMSSLTMGHGPRNGTPTKGTPGSARTVIRAV